MTICVIFNPKAARGRAQKRLEALRASLGKEVEFRPTKESGHAEELSSDAARAGFSIVAAAGGDGTVHEVANGLLRANRPEVGFAVFPLGSANDYAFSLGLNAKDHMTLPVDREFRQVDVGWVQSETGKDRFFVNSLGLGFSGLVSVESRRIQWLQGLPLYGLAFLRTLCWRFECPNMTATFDGQTRTAPTLSLTVAIGPREGSFVVARDAVIDDGLFDYLQAGGLSRWELLRYMPRLAGGGELPRDHPRIWQGRCREVTLESETPLTVHLDGEFFALPENPVRRIQIQMLPGRLKVLTWRKSV
ncbi:MAG TPA: diacylglycerol kinase family protein [Gemmataceae bacterium]|nr:diacylglycerol kinase family protein [Gemmataceae bacterium]